MQKNQLFSHKPVRLPMQDAEVWYYPSFFSVEESDQLFLALHEKIAWKQESIVMFGKRLPQPRLTAWYGEAGRAYTYSGLTWQPQPWTQDLLTIKERIEKTAGTSFTSVLLNLYRDGTDSMGWHADNEKELGPNPVIGSVSFGDTRTFAFKHRTAKEQRCKVALEHGSFLLMAGPTQHHWLHQVAKTKKAVGTRINLTFRVIT